MILAICEASISLSSTTSTFFYLVLIEQCHIIEQQVQRFVFEWVLN